MKFGEYQKLSKRTMPDLFDPMSRANAAMGLAGEAGEAVDLIKKQLFHGHEMPLEKLIHEVGDIQFYLALIAELYGFTLEEAATLNVEKLRKRYAEGFSTQASINRVDVTDE